MWKGVVIPDMTIRQFVNDAFQGLISPETKKNQMVNSCPSICRQFRISPHHLIEFFSNG